MAIHFEPIINTHRKVGAGLLKWLVAIGSFPKVVSNNVFERINTLIQKSFGIMFVKVCAKEYERMLVESFVDLRIVPV